jgi:glycyl-tRNA synthetase beta subunit
MAELLLELLSEEIPARMQARAADDLRPTASRRPASNSGRRAPSPRRAAWHWWSRACRRRVPM